MGPPGKRVTACSAPLKIAFAPALIIALKGRAGAAVTLAALGEAETPVAGPPVPIRVVICPLLLAWKSDPSSAGHGSSCQKRAAAARGNRWLAHWASAAGGPVDERVFLVHGSPALGVGKRLVNARK
jgi:hypothetical protein